MQSVIILQVGQVHNCPSYQSFNGGGGRKGSCSGYVLKVEPTGFLAGLNVEFEKRGGIRSIEQLETELLPADLGSTWGSQNMRPLLMDTLDWRCLAECVLDI